MTARDDLLDAARDARLNGEASTKAEELALIRRMIADAGETDTVDVTATI